MFLITRWNLKIVISIVKCITDIAITSEDENIIHTGRNKFLLLMLTNVMKYNLVEFLASPAPCFLWKIWNCLKDLKCNNVTNTPLFGKEWNSHSSKLKYIWWTFNPQLFPLQPQVETCTCINLVDDTNDMPVLVHESFHIRLNLKSMVHWAWDSQALCTIDYQVRFVNIRGWSIRMAVM